MVKLIVRVRDVDGKEYKPPYYVARFSVAGGGGSIVFGPVARLVPGVATDLPVAIDTVNLTVGTQAPGFSSETFSLKKVGTEWLADTPAATVSAQEDTVSVDVIDGTVRLAPTVYLPREQLVSTNPKAILCEPGQGWIYYGAWLANPPVNLVKNPIVFKDDVPDTYPYEPKGSVKEEGVGNLVFLEYGFNASATPPERGPRFLIGVWAPRVVIATPPPVLVFYTPPTKPDSYPADAYPFVNAYPYSPFVDPPPRPGVPAAKLVQPYPYLAVNYLLAGYKIVPQILAARRNPIIIFPVCPSMNWGPLGTQTGMSRLIKEVVRFLYARQIVSSKVAPTARLSLDAGRASIVPPSGLFTREPIPPSWALTVSGFSNGIDKVLDLCTPLPIDEKEYDPAIFSSPEATLVESWREIWDIDGVADDGKGANRHLKTLRQWLKTDRRRVRSYHSDTGMTTAPRGLVEASRLVSRPSPPYKGIFIEEGTSADEKATWVHFSDAALKKSVYDAHHTVPAIAFGHAAQFPMP
jgi:hypothetical protein